MKTLFKFLFIISISILSGWSLLNDSDRVIKFEYGLNKVKKIYLTLFKSQPVGLGGGRLSREVNRSDLFASVLPPVDADKIETGYPNVTPPYLYQILNKKISYLNQDEAEINELGHQRILLAGKNQLKAAETAFMVEQIENAALRADHIDLSKCLPEDYYVELKLRLENINPMIIGN